ncbi:MAG TPA: Gfo/Idh/MocA family oxidoreductase [Candidatus Dormibacteraeota bacterium]|nr:Gfo/Idh/MocA family oxidoreductase [Candidatus Dormibacteraeota bacterium]
MRISVLGAGRIGVRRAELLAAMPEVHEVVLGNRSLARAEAVAERVPKVRALTLEAALAEPVDAAVVCLASSEHLPALRRLLPRGLPVLCEKPLGMTLAETEEAIALAEQGRGVQVGFQRRFDPGYRAARELVGAGRLGTLYSISMVSLDHELTPEGFIPSSGGIFRDLLIHDFDVARWLTGHEITTVTAYTTVRVDERFRRHHDADTALVLGVMEDGLPLVIRASRHDPVGHDVRMEVLGSRDSVAVGWSSKTPVRSLDPDGARPDHPYTSFLERFDAAFRAETEAFVRFAQGEDANPCPPESSLRALQVALACERSVASGGPVKVATVGDRSAPS